MRRGQQPPWIVSDELWQRIEPLLPKPQRNRRHPGRKRIPDRKVLCGILFVLHTVSTAIGVMPQVLKQLLSTKPGSRPGLGGLCVAATAALCRS